MNYAKLIDGALIYAPRKMNTTIDDEPYVVYNPPAEMLEADGWLPVVYTDPPEAPEGYHYEPTYTEEIGEIVQGWELVEDPPDIPAEEALDIILGGGANDED